MIILDVKRPDREQIDHSIYTLVRPIIQMICPPRNSYYNRRIPNVKNLLSLLYENEKAGSFQSD